ncbi:MAG: 4-hydroxy-tetrahydrodipicolinate synthase [Bacteroidetes bacterium]|nr:MAG: 4-hydroxy-tetrahydrodipicolinate synthase [Bacteroidota bacterium]
MLQHLTGTGVALVTPFTANEEVDFNALGQLIDYVINGGVNYVVSLGTTGETPVLDGAEQHDIVRFTVEKVAGRVPVVVGMGSNDTRQLAKKITQFNWRGVTAILSASPYYNKPSQNGIVAHYEAVAKSTDLPILLYNVPGRTGRNMTAATTLTLAEKYTNIAGIKEASGDMVQCMEIIKNAPKNFLVVSGDDALASAQIATGMQGVISVAANCVPATFSALVNASLQQQFSEAVSIQNKLLRLYDLLFIENNPAGAKSLLAQKGIVQNILRLPLTPLSKTYADELAAYVAMP